MKLPIFEPLENDQSTYITFSKSLLDLDKAKVYDTPYFYSRMVALNLPNYVVDEFFIDLSEVGITSDNPNITIPKGMQYYMENIVRQPSNTENIVELAFYKFLNKCGMSYADIHASITFMNDIAISNFTQVENNNGWMEIVGVVPNICHKLIKAFKNVDVPDIMPSSPDNNSDECIFDNGNMEFLFSDPLSKQVIDFDNTSHDTEIQNEDIKFNVLLFFYRDAAGVDKLHGINFVNPFSNKITYYELPPFIKKTSDARSIGYQFKVNLKTVNNEATKILVQEWNSGPEHWNTYLETLSGLNSFLHLQELQGNIANP